MKVYLVSNTSGSTLKYILTNVSSISYSARSNPMVITLPEMDQPMVMNFTGRTNTLSIHWKIINSDEDLSDGTNSSAIKTINEQLDYLQSNFMSADIMACIGIVIENDDGTNFYSAYGLPTGLSWSWNGGETALSATMTFIENMLTEGGCS